MRKVRPYGVGEGLLGWQPRRQGGTPPIGGNREKKRGANPLEGSAMAKKEVRGRRYERRGGDVLAPIEIDEDRNGQRK